MAYTKKDWNTGDVIDEASMDNIENGIEANDTKNTEQDGKIAENASKNTEQDSKISALEGKTGEATASKAGLMSAADKKEAGRDRGEREQIHSYGGYYLCTWRRETGCCRIGCSRSPYAGGI